jgi:hypothetical protein
MTPPGIDFKRQYFMQCNISWLYTVNHIMQHTNKVQIQFSSWEYKIHCLATQLTLKSAQTLKHEGRKQNYDVIYFVY